MSNKFIFVYGTLMRGFGANEYMRDGDMTEYVGRGHLLPAAGLKMQALHSYPALVPYDGLIHPDEAPKGELYEVKNQDVWRRLDMYEGYTPDGTGLYDKKNVTVEFWTPYGDKEVVQATCYYMTQEYGIMPRYVEDGNWRTWVNSLRGARV